MNEAEAIRKAAREVILPHMDTSPELAARVQALVQFVKTSSWVPSLAGQGPGFDSTTAANPARTAPSYDDWTRVPSAAQIREEFSGKFTCEACRTTFSSLPEAANHLQLGQCSALPKQVNAGSSAAWAEREPISDHTTVNTRVNPPSSQLDAGQVRQWTPAQAKEIADGVVRGLRKVDDRLAKRAGERPDAAGKKRAALWLLDRTGLTESRWPMLRRHVLQELGIAA